MKSICPTNLAKRLGPHGVLGRLNAPLLSRLPGQEVKVDFGRSQPVPIPCTWHAHSILEVVSSILEVVSWEASHLVIDTR